MQFPQLRKEFTQAGLHEADVDADPIRQFRRWFDDASPPACRNRTR